MTFDNTQKRGHPKNSGSWSAYNNSDPEGALEQPGEYREIFIRCSEVRAGDILLKVGQGTGDEDGQYGVADGPMRSTDDTLRAIPLRGGGNLRVNNDDDAMSVRRPLIQETPRYGEFVVGLKDVRRGDVLINDDGGVLGVADGPLNTTDGVHRIRLAAGGALRCDSVDEQVIALRTEQPPAFDTSDYWGSVAALAHPNVSKETLAYAALHTAEDDHYRAIALHPNSTSTVLDLVGNHNSSVVRELVAVHPETPDDTLVRMLAEAQVAQYEAAQRVKLGVNPMQGQYKWEEQNQAELGALIAEQLAARNAE